MAKIEEAAKVAKVDVSYSTEEEREYITINGRKSRIHYNRGYQYTSSPTRNGTIGVHRIIMELKMGRRLKRSEHVHHIDKNKTNNNLSNLQLVDGSVHTSSHTRKNNLKHNPKTFVCKECGRSNVKHKAYGMCNTCYGASLRKKTVEQPCLECGKETKSRKKYGGLCSRCASNRFDSCIECERTRAELPGKEVITQISGEGLCRACATRRKRTEKQKR